MPATYPLAVRTFSQKRNLLEDVDASHVNDLQDEVKAIQTVLGIRPNVDSVSGVIYPNVDQRIAAIRQGLDAPAFHLVQSNDYTLASRPLDYERDVIAVQPGDDTHGFSDGTGVTLGRGGWYHLDVSAVFGPTTTTWSRHVSLLAMYGNATSWSRVVSGTVRAADHNGSANASYCAPFPKGTRLAVACALDEGRFDVVGGGSVQVRYARLMGHMVREV